MSDIADKVIDIIAERLDKEKDAVKPESNVIADLGADSLDIAEIMMDLEDAFGVKLEDDNAEGPQTVGDIIKFIEQKVAESNG
ncbi:MAG: acyl carrier protein [Planctomycetota bacterium]